MAEQNPVEVVALHLSGEDSDDASDSEPIAKKPKINLLDYFTISDDGNKENFKCKKCK